ncbi:HAD-IB family hydrolase [Pseudomonas stutzeri]|nr:HAD-IB family hydrolase [Stutzerimonas stutzeri]
MALALFDLDDTLIGGNSPSLWTAYLADLGWVDRESFLTREQALVAQYAALQATLEDYLAFSVQPLIGRTAAEVEHVVAPFVEAVIEPLILSDAMRAVAAHRAAGDRVLVVSASPTFLVAAIAERLGIGELLATELELRHGCYSGGVAGIPCAREGKIARLERWRAEQDETLAGAHFYSDSRNDLPLLGHVEHPHAVNPDAALRAHAERHGWDILTWR